MPEDRVETLSRSQPVLPVPSAMPPFGVSDIRKRTRAIQEVMRGVMKEGTHFGTIPGTPKPSLWKAGAEVLCMTFRLVPLLESRVTSDSPEEEWTFAGIRKDGTSVSGTCIGFFEVEAVCTIQGASGEVLSRCSARCNNREAKYRTLPMYDLRNTIVKMAEKRAFVSAVLMATGASDIFTQDMEDLPEMTAAPGVQPLETQSQAKKTAGAGLTPKRETWLIRAAHEAQVPVDATEKCLAFLRGAESPMVKSFFDDLSKGRDVFTRFLAKVG